MELLRGVACPAKVTKQSVGAEKSIMKFTFHTTSSITIVGLLLVHAAVALSRAEESSGDKNSLPKPQLALLERFCTECHDTETQEGKLDLASIFTSPIAKHSATWEKVVRKLKHPPNAAFGFRSAFVQRSTCRSFPLWVPASIITPNVIRIPDHRKHLRRTESNRISECYQRSARFGYRCECSTSC